MLSQILSSPWFWGIAICVLWVITGQRKKTPSKALIVQRADTPALTTSDEAVYAMGVIVKAYKENGVPAEEITRWQNETALKLLVREA